MKKKVNCSVKTARGHLLGAQRHGSVTRERPRFSEGHNDITPSPRFLHSEKRPFSGVGHAGRHQEHGEVIVAPSSDCLSDLAH